MKQSPPRPLSVWITQILIVLFIVIPSVLTLFMLVPECFSSNSTFDCSRSVERQILLNQVGAIAVSLLMVWGLQKRKRYAQWLMAVFFVVGVMLALRESDYLPLIYRAITQGQPLPPPPYDCWKQDHPYDIVQEFCGYRSYPELVLRVGVDLLVAAGFGWLATRLLLSPAAKQFFQKD